MEYVLANASTKSGRSLAARQSSSCSCVTSLAFLTAVIVVRLADGAETVGRKARLFVDNATEFAFEIGNNGVEMNAIFKCAMNESDASHELTTGCGSS